MIFSAVISFWRITVLMNYHSADDADPDGQVMTIYTGRVENVV